MAATDTFTYSMGGKAAARSRSGDHLLITQERMQKLELSLHLLANLPQPVAICGPAGIGKTTLLRALQESKMSVFAFCLLKGSAELSFEAIQQQLGRSAVKNKTALSKKTALLIDDAGALMPGLMTAIMQYAWSNPGLRVVFALTHDEAQVKSRTDPVIDDCHFIEIPPLSEPQCGEFLRQLAAMSRMGLPLNAIDDGLIRLIYRRTHGIPGKIITELPRLVGRKKGIAAIWILLVAVASLVAAAFAVQWYSVSPYNAARVATPVTERPAAEPPAPAATKNAPPVKISEQILDQYAGVAPPVAHEQWAAPAATTVEIQPANNAVVASQPPADAQPVHDRPPKAEVVAAEPVKAPASSDKGRVVATESAPMPAPSPSDDTQDEGTAWLNSQPSGNYTLQVMLLSKEQAVKNFQRKYPSLAQDLKYTKTVTGSKERFLLFYGSFASSEAAQQAKQSLPREFRQSLVKRIGVFKK